MHIVILDGCLIWIVAYLLPSQHTPARRYKRSGLGLISSEVAHSNVCPEEEKTKKMRHFSKTIQTILALLAMQT